MIHARFFPLPCLVGWQVGHPITSACCSTPDSTFLVSLGFKATPGLTVFTRSHLFLGVLLMCCYYLDYSTFWPKPVFDCDFCPMILDTFALSANPLPPLFLFNHESSQAHCTAACALPTCLCTDLCLVFVSWIFSCTLTVPLLRLTLPACLLTTCLSVWHRFFAWALPVFLPGLY